MAYEREIPLYTLEGVRDADVSVHPFSTEDKLGLGLHRFTRGESDDIVLIIHGLTTSMDMFIMPEHTNLVSYLLDNGFSDVWCLDFRMSNRFNYNLAPHRFTMDDIALYDYPPALEKIRQISGKKRIHVICHCLGSVSFMMSLFGGVVDGITSVIANSVSLTPRVPAWSKLKIGNAPFFVESVLSFPYLSPAMGDDPALTRQKMFAKLVTLFHRECDVSGCHMLSLMWGTGWPALYEHKNLADVTHRRGRDLYGATSMHYYRHVKKMLKAGGAVKYDPDNKKHAALPNDYFEHARDIKTPVLFMTGKHNRVFTDSNIYCHERLRKMGCDWHELHVFPGYGHQDPFMGQTVHLDIFPRLLQHLRKYGPEAGQVRVQPRREVTEAVSAG
ncbi:MAG: alpha/beta fold hydrolase [Gemmatimonadota bacterium]